MFEKRHTRISHRPHPLDPKPDKSRFLSAVTFLTQLATLIPDRFLVGLYRPDRFGDVAMKYFTLTISALALAASSASAADLSVKAPPMQPAIPQASGYVEVYSGGSWLEDAVSRPLFFGNTSTIKYDAWPIGGAGRGNWWATNNFSIQVDAQAEGTQYRVPQDLLQDPTISNRFSTLSYLVGGHANLRDAQRGLIGVFGGIGDVGGNGTTRGFFGSASGVRHAVGGAEGQIYWNALTLYAQGGYDQSLDFGNTSFVNDAHAWFFRGTARYFFMPNFMIEGTGQYSKGALGHSTFGGPPISDTNFDMWRASIKAEWRPDALPFSVFAKYEHNQTNYDANNSVFFLTPAERVSENRVMAGLRLYLGQNTLLANDRTGATLDINDPLGSPTSPLMFNGFAQQLFVSDTRLKRDIQLVGKLDNGLGLYRYRYLWSDTEYVGVMAQEVALIQPRAVVHGLDGYLRVNYRLVGVPFRTLAQWQSSRG